jgi:hypothetical protein
MEQNIVENNNNNSLPNNNNVSYEKYNRNTEKGANSPNKKIQVIIDKNNKQALEEIYEVLESSPTFGYCLRLKRVPCTLSDEGAQKKKKLKVQIDTHKKSNVVLQTGIDGIADTLTVDPNAIPYTYGDDETIILGDFSSSDDDSDWSSEENKN